MSFLSNNDEWWKVNDEWGSFCEQREPDSYSSRGFKYSTADYPSDYAACVKAANEANERAIKMLTEFAAWRLK